MTEKLEAELDEALREMADARSYEERTVAGQRIRELFARLKRERESEHDNRLL